MDFARHRNGPKDNGIHILAWEYHCHLKRRLFSPEDKINKETVQRRYCGYADQTN